MGKLSERLKEWYGMPEFQPSKVDEGILVIIDEVAQLEEEITKLNYIKLPNEKASNVFEAYLAWKSESKKLEAKMEKLTELQKHYEPYCLHLEPEVVVYKSTPTLAHLVETVEKFITIMRS